MRTVRGVMNLPLQQTHSIDSDKGELLATSLSSRIIRDHNYGGQGERETVIPTIRNISLTTYDFRLNEYAVKAKNGDATAQSLEITFGKLTPTNIKGIRCY